MAIRIKADSDCSAVSFGGPANYGAAPAVTSGMALPMGLILAGVGAIVGLIVKRNSGCATPSGSPSACPRALKRGVTRLIKRTRNVWAVDQLRQELCNRIAALVCNLLLLWLCETEHFDDLALGGDCCA